jgi:prepilin-type N-terminal cleavage/methylation domain-containing protein
VILQRLNKSKGFTLIELIICIAIICIAAAMIIPGIVWFFSGDDDNQKVEVIIKHEEKIPPINDTQQESDSEMKQL